MDMHVTYGKSEDYEVVRLNYFRYLYFQKNYGGKISKLPKDSKILEIGPGGGTFAEYLMQNGFSNITLCEYSSLIAGELSNYFKGKSGIKVINDNAINYLQDSKVKYDVIISQQVIEHFSYDDFVVLLKCIYDSLNKNGVVILETNNCANIFYGIYLRYCDHTHLLGFTPRSLENFLKTQNLVIQDIFPIHMTGVGDLVLAVGHGLFNKQNQVAIKTFNKQIASTPFTSKIGLGIAFILRSWGIIFSRLVSFLFIYPYDKSLGFKRSVFTPTFGIVAKKKI